MFHQLIYIFFLIVNHVNNVQTHAKIVVTSLKFKREGELSVGLVRLQVKQTWGLNIVLPSRPCDLNSFIHAPPLLLSVEGTNLHITSQHVHHSLLLHHIH